MFTCNPRREFYRVIAKIVLATILGAVCAYMWRGMKHQEQMARAAAGLARPSPYTIEDTTLVRRVELTLQAARAETARADPYVRNKGAIKRYLSDPEVQAARARFEALEADTKAEYADALKAYEDRPPAYPSDDLTVWMHPDAQTDRGSAE